MTKKNIVYILLCVYTVALLISNYYTALASYQYAITRWQNFKYLVIIANLSRQIVEKGRLKQELNSDLLAVYGILEGDSKSSCF